MLFADGIDHQEPFSFAGIDTILKVLAAMGKTPAAVPIPTWT